MLGGGAKQLQTTWAEKLRLEGDRFKILFSSVQMTRLTLLVWLTYICDYWGFTVAGKTSPANVTRPTVLILIQVLSYPRFWL
jgi:hypothetical protein